MLKGYSKIFRIENRIEEIPTLAEKVEDLTSEWKLSPELTMNINLVIEEAVSNIIFYAFNDNKKHHIEISLSLNNNQLTIETTDDGVPFNPLEQQDPDITLSAEERPIGGLGIFLITQIMDDLNYNRKNKKNVLTLKKTI